MKAYSMDLRKRVLAMCDAGRTTCEVARAYDISEPWVRRLKQRRREDGVIAARPSGGWRHGHFDSARLQQLEVWATSASRRDTRMAARSRESRDRFSLQRDVGVSGGPEAGVVANKKTLRAAEQDRPDVIRRRMNFAIAHRFADIDQFIFLDESGAKTNMTRLYGRAPIGQRCFCATPHGHWKTTTMLSAIHSTGVVKDASIVFDGPTDATVFRSYVEQCLAPALTPGDIVVMDNLSSHKVAGVVEAIEPVGASVWYLPPYSPDLNPIERMWSKVKTWLRRVAARTVAVLIQAVGDALRTVDADECRA